MPDLPYEIAFYAGGFPVTTHHNEPCKMCEGDASAFNHCSVCGYTGLTSDDFSGHLDGPCGDFMTKLMESMGGM